MVNFTPEQIADVYAKRWKIRDIGNYFTREFADAERRSLLSRYAEPTKVIRTVGYMVKIKVPGGH